VRESLALYRTNSPVRDHPTTFDVARLSRSVGADREQLLYLVGVFANVSHLHHELSPDGRTVTIYAVDRVVGLLPPVRLRWWARCAESVRSITFAFARWPRTIFSRSGGLGLSVPPTARTASTVVEQARAGRP